MFRDEHCQFPGCWHRRYVDGHHVDHWAHGGETSLENTVLVCGFHHTLLHEGGFRMEKEGERWLLSDPRGRVVPAGGVAQARLLDWVKPPRPPRCDGGSVDYGAAVAAIR